MRYAVLALIVVGVVGTGVAVDRSEPSRVAIPAIELAPATRSASAPAASPPTLKRAYGGRRLSRPSSPPADRQPLRAGDDRPERPHATTSAPEVPTDAGADDRSDGPPETTGSVRDDGTPSGESDKPKPPQEPQAPETPDTPETPDKPETPDTPETPETPETPDTPSAPEAPPSPGDPAPTDEDEDEDGGGGPTPTPAPASTPAPVTDDDFDDNDDDEDDADESSGSRGGGSSDSGSDGGSHSSEGDSG